MIGDALMDSLGGALGGSSGAGTLPPPRAKVSRGGSAPSAGGFGAELVAMLTGPAQPDPAYALQYLAVGGLWRPAEFPGPISRVHGGVSSANFWWAFSCCRRPSVPFPISFAVATVVRSGGLSFGRAGGDRALDSDSGDRADVVDGADVSGRRAS